MSENNGAKPLSPFLAGMVTAGILDSKRAEIVQALPGRELQEKALNQYREKSENLMREITARILREESGKILADGKSPYRDPLNDGLWPVAKNDIEQATFYWDYNYDVMWGEETTVTDPLMAWHFHIQNSAGSNPWAFLKKWFLHVAEALGEPGLEALPPEEVRKHLAQRFAPATDQEKHEKDQAMEQARIPANGMEEEELYTAAVRGPESGYAWIYGADSFFARRVRGLRWKDLYAAHYQVGINRAVENQKQTIPDK